MGGFINVFLNCLFLLLGKEFFNQRMLGGQAAIRAAEKRVDAGGEDIKASFFVDKFEVDRDAGGLADPVFLHLHGGLRPIDEFEIVGKAVRISGDFEDPLPHRHANNGKPPRSDLPSITSSLAKTVPSSGQ